MIKFSLESELRIQTYLGAQASNIPQIDSTRMHYTGELLPSQWIDLDAVKVINQLTNDLVLQLLSRPQYLLLLTDLIGFVLAIAQVEVGVGVQRHPRKLHGHVAMPSFHVLVELQAVLRLELTLVDLVHWVLERLSW